MNSMNAGQAALVLVVDDDKNSRNLLSKQLRHSGYQVMTASNGKEALERYYDEGPDLILLDATMPVMDGFSTCEAIRTSPHGTNIPILITTGLTDRESIDRVFACGATDYMAKPIELDLLTHRVNYLTRMRQMEKQERLHHQLLKQVTSQMNALFIVLDQTGRFVLAEGQELAKMGINSKAVTGQSALELYQDKPELLQYINHALAGQTLSTLLIFNNSKLEMHFQPVRAGNQLQGCTIFGFDVTAHLKTEEALYSLSQIVEDSTSAVIITDIQGQIEYVNYSFEALTGYTRQEVVGQNPRILKSGIMSLEGYQELWKALVDGQRWEGVLCDRKKSGELYWINAKFSSIRNRAGQITHYAAVQDDITKYRHHEDVIRQLSLAVQQSASTVVITDLDGKIEYVNPSFTRLTGYTFEEVKGRTHVFYNQD